MTSTDSNSGSVLQIHAHYFIDGRRIYFKKINIDEAVSIFENQDVNDIRKMLGINPNVEWVETQLEYLKEMIRQNLIEYIDQ